MKKLIALCLAALLVLAALPALADTTPWPKDQPFVPLAADGKVTAGTLFFVPMPENPTTGYLVSCKTDPEQGILLPMGDFFVSDQVENGEMMTGVGGTHWFFFYAQKDGEVTLIFSEAREWETTANPLDVIQVTVAPK